jgi:hypothetical protein
MTLNIELPDEKVAVLAVKARARGLSTEEYARKCLSRILCRNGSRNRGKALKRLASISFPWTRSKRK